VAHIMQYGGTILRSRRCEDFRTDEGLQKAADNLHKHNIEGLIVIGGDGTLRGAVDCPFSTRTLTLGHVQRGGVPTPADRILTSELGDHAVRALVAGAHSVMSGKLNGNLVLIPLIDGYSTHKPIPSDLQELLTRMTR